MIHESISPLFICFSLLYIQYSCLLLSTRARINTNKHTKSTPCRTLLIVFFFSMTKLDKNPILPIAKYYFVWRWAVEDFHTWLRLWLNCTWVCFPLSAYHLASCERQTGGPKFPRWGVLVRFEHFICSDPTWSDLSWTQQLEELRISMDRASCRSQLCILGYIGVFFHLKCHNSHIV